MSMIQRVGMRRCHSSQTGRRVDGTIRVIVSAERRWRRPATSPVRRIMSYGVGNVWRHQNIEYVISTMNRTQCDPCDGNLTGINCAVYFVDELDRQKYKKTSIKRTSSNSCCNTRVSTESKDLTTYCYNQKLQSNIHRHDREYNSKINFVQDITNFLHKLVSRKMSFKC